MGYRDYSAAKGHIVDATGHGDFTTIGAALTAASSGQTIFIRPGTYTENPTLVAGVNLTAFDGDISNVIIVGKCTLTVAGSVTISNIQIQTNSDFAIAVTGSAASALTLNNCYINCVNTTGISYTSSSASSEIILGSTTINLATTGIALYSMSSIGNLIIDHCSFGNSGLSTTASSNSAGTVTIYYSLFSSPLSTTSTGGIQLNYATVLTQASNTLALTCNGTGISQLTECLIRSGTASAITVGSGATLFCFGQTAIGSTNANPITGAGTIDYNSFAFTNNSVNSINTSTINANSTNMTKVQITGLGIGALPTASGLTFNGTDVISNYDIGTFTPTMVGTVAGTTTYTVQNGYYTRIGNQVTIWGNVQGSAATGTGSVIFGGFPFTIKNQTGYAVIGSVLSANNATWVFPVGTTSQVFSGIVNSTTAHIYVSGTASVGATLQMANAAFAFEYSLTYQI